MVARGRVQNGVVVLDNGVRLPEGQEVTVLTPETVPTHARLEGARQDLDNDHGSAAAGAPTPRFRSGGASDDIRLQGQFTIVGATTPVSRKVFFSRGAAQLISEMTGETV